MRLTLAALAAIAFGASLGAAPVAAQTLPAPAPVAAPAASPAAPAAARPPAAPKPAPKPPEARRRGPPKAYAHCLGLARKDGLRGAERRRWVARCQLGYEA